MEQSDSHDMRAWLCAMVLVALQSDPARACIYPTLPEHQLDPAHASDQIAPEAPGVTYEVEYFKSDKQTTCDDTLGLIRLAIISTDDRAPPDRLGIVTAPAATAHLPRGFRMFPQARDEAAPYGVDPPNRIVSFRFDHDVKIVDFEIDVQVVDLNGNFSPKTRVHVMNDASGCSVGSSSAGWPAVAFGTLAMLACTLRRRRRAEPSTGGFHTAPPRRIAGQAEAPKRVDVPERHI